MTRYTIMIVTNPDYGDPEILVFSGDEGEEAEPILTLPLTSHGYGMIGDVTTALATHGYRTVPSPDLPNRGDHWTTTNFGAVATAHRR